MAWHVVTWAVILNPVAISVTAGIGVGLWNLAPPRIAQASIWALPTALDDTWTTALILMAAMPTAATAFILSHEPDQDGRLVAAVIVVTSVVAVVMVPLARVLAT
ncbi:hypothetical protein N8K70_04580 [Microbacterium betulae]|uniref:Uncharacterized protein n=1 Tax=Microbacterium betulae TaxID=2981139 RepID=A0AA97FI18_9MICO|nr:hypothetical protein [Microbacterium sp. AB]WOF23961.1 hypothetical protein N8K70_04580 [Microbacterium sp. AB]